MKKKIALFMCLSITTCLAGCSIVQLRGTVPEYKQETYTSSGNISSIVLCDTDVPIEICNSNNDEIVLCYYNADHKSEIYVIEEAVRILIVDKKTEPNYSIFIFTIYFQKEKGKNYFNSYIFYYNINKHRFWGNIRF